MINIAQTGGNGLTVISKANFDTLVTANSLSVGRFYQISYIGVNDFLTGIVGTFMAMTTNTISDEGVGVFYNAAYGVKAQWASGGVYAAGVIVIYNNYHYSNIAGNNTGNPAATPADWTIVPYGHSSYVVESNAILYNYTNDNIYRRWDKLGNDISTSAIGILNNFQWGNANVYSNDLQNSNFNIRNMITNFFKNSGNDTTLTYVTLSGNPLVNNNTFKSSALTFGTFGGTWTNMLIDNVTVDNTTVMDIIFNKSIIKDTTFVACSIHQILGSYISNSTFNLASEIFINYSNIYTTDFLNFTQYTLANCYFVNSSPISGNGVANSTFNQCQFINFRVLAFVFNTTGSEVILLCSYSNNEIIIFTEFSFTGLAGRGAVGAYTLPTFALPANVYLYAQQIYITTVLVGVGATFSMGIQTDAPTVNFNAAAVAAVNAASQNLITGTPPTANTASTAIRKVVATIGVAAITSGIMQVTSTYKLFKS